ncbi:DUF6471 domain-containing protein [Pararobbsia silviterrae]|uniref:DUF6471 domain-containing protein n=1 Tax=Pararobbsia silviterrae TaxID=1792498 RepID=A0A494WZY3_9BURK|nr:DUF6471 domain-containing protein [Pararobbsia silviterrae]RKP44088.1 hypothetical protein D7S86_28135 [Pararobbsia silviterrae]
MEKLQRVREGKLVDPYATWEEGVKALIEGEMERREIRYKELSRRLEKLGIYESADQINRKINRMRFSAAFLFACLSALGVTTVSLHVLWRGRDFDE